VVVQPKGFRPWNEVKEAQLKEEKDTDSSCAHLGIPSRNSVGTHLLLVNMLTLTF
jgi:hypothetical protein